MILMIALSMGCWIIGRTPVYEAFQKRLRAWGWGAICAAAGLGLFFYFLPPPQTETQVAKHGHEYYTPAKLESLLSEGKTVFIDFTANW